jgi:2-iminobutanoate/2-iminopropanoate deaminase
MKKTQDKDTNKPQAFGAYSPLRLAGELAYVSGQIGIDPLTGYIDEDPIKQGAQALRNIETILGGIGMGLRDVVDTTIYVTDMSVFSDIDELYRTEFTAADPNRPYPARAFVAVAELPRLGGDIPVKVEIKAIAMEQSS